MTESLKQFTMEQVTENNYIIIDGNVYNFKEFEETHPGGAKVLQFFRGKNASQKFHNVEHHIEKVKNNLRKYMVGSLQKE
jgi:cytochrome b involved in lipid metabolism